MKSILRVTMFVVVLILLTTAASYAQTAPPGDPVALLAWLKGNAILLQLVVGIVWKYAPFLKGVSNQLIPWVNVAVFVLATLAGVAVAAGPEVQVVHRSFFSTVFLGFLHSGVAKVLYDGWLKPALDSTVGKLTGTA